MGVLVAGPHRAERHDELVDQRQLDRNLVAQAVGHGVEAVRLVHRRAEDERVEDQHARAVVADVERCAGGTRSTPRTSPRK